MAVKNSFERRFDLRTALDQVNNQRENSSSDRKYVIATYDNGEAHRYDANKRLEKAQIESCNLVENTILINYASPSKRLFKIKSELKRINMSHSLMELNERLCSLEMAIRPIYTAMNDRLQREVDDGEIYDFEIELQIDFYTVNDEEPLAQYFHYMPSKKELGIQIGDGENHNDFYHWTEHEMSGEKHCWLYHSLYDHIRLSTEEMLRIDRVWWDINVSYQYGNLGFEKKEIA